jgi:SAM-dependent methyltransferase
MTMEFAQPDKTAPSILNMLCCPRCNGRLDAEPQRLVCADCKQAYPVVDNIPQLFWFPDWETSKPDITRDMKAFYEAYPFPNYDDFDSVGTLIEKARKGIFAKLLDDQVPFGARIIECGCGTGQLTNFLSIAGRTAIGTDMCLNSLRMAHNFKEKNSLKRALFLQMNLFRPCFKAGQFDLVISNGVLHHTSDPFLGFRSIANLVKPGGYILIGLYHKYGRLSTDLRRAIFRITKDRLKGLDTRMNESISQARKRAWYMDQYKNPHESKHTIGEVMGWLRETGFSFIKSVPKTVPLQPFLETEELFVEERPGSWIIRSIVEFGMALTAGRDGGLFIVIARRPSHAAN